MKILKLSPYYYPEQVSSSHLTDDLDKVYAEEGFIQENYVPMPSRGVSNEVRKQYLNKKEEVLCDGKIIIHRFSMFREGKNPIQRALRYILVNIIQYHKGIKTENADVVFGASTPPTQGLLCAAVKKKLSKKYKRPVPFVYNLQDVFPDSLVSAGMTHKGSLIWKIGRVIEKRTYNNADTIIVISHDIKRNIIKKGVNEEKIAVIPNWIDTNKVTPVNINENSLFKELGLDHRKFYIVYAGNLGLAQGIDVLIEAAKELNGYDDIQFVLFGAGTNMDYYAEKCKGLRNVRIFPLMPRERVAEVYSIGNLCYVACKSGLGQGAVPSKTFSIMATARPILLSFDKDTELWDIIRDNQCGLCVDADNVSKIVDAVLFAYTHPEIMLEMGENARTCAESIFSREICTKKYVSVIKQITNQTEHPF